MKKKIKAVIFDMDGVLVDSEISGYKYYKQASLEVGAKWDDDMYLSTLGMTFADSDRKYIEFYGSKDILDKVVQRYHKLFFDDAYPNGDVPLKKGCREVIEYVQENNIPHCLATGSPMYVVDLSFLNQGYDKVPFEHIVTGDEVVNGKPDPEIFIKAAKLMNVDVQDCMIVEDSRNGIKAAHNANALAVLVPDIIKPDEEMLNNADYVKNDLLEVKDLIAELIVKD